MTVRVSTSKSNSCNLSFVKATNEQKLNIEQVMMLMTGKPGSRDYQPSSASTSSAPMALTDSDSWDDLGALFQNIEDRMKNDGCWEDCTSVASTLEYASDASDKVVFETII